MRPPLRTIGRVFTCVCIAVLLATSSARAQRTPTNVPTGAAGGDLAGTYPNPSVAKIQGTAVSAAVPTPGQVLTFDGRGWAPATASVGGGSPCAGCVVAFANIRAAPAGPGLYGTVPASCSFFGPKSANVIACTAISDQAMVITIAGVNYTETNYVTLVTPTSHPAVASAGAYASSGHLFIGVSSGGRGADVMFVTFKAP